MLPSSLVVPLQEHVARVQRCMRKTSPTGYGSVYLPFVLERKYPRAGRLWFGHTCFPPTGCRETPARGPSAGVTPVRVVCNGPLARPVVWQGSPNASVVIPSGTALRRICSSRATISGRCKNCWATKM